ncbi:hypothetical protein D3C72_1919920 [compost metagenome]
MLPDTSAPTLTSELACNTPDASTVDSISPRATVTVSGAVLAWVGARKYHQPAAAPPPSTSSTINILAKRFMGRAMPQKKNP